LSNTATVLVVDDEEYIRDSLRMVLEGQGYRVRTASGPTALSRPGVLDGLDAVITDLKMPDGNGVELVRRVKDRSPQIPVIVLTAFGSIPSAVECVKAGACEFLEKPAGPDELVRTLRRILAEGAPCRRNGAEPLSRNGETRSEPIGQSAAWRRILEIVEAAAPTDTNVLLLGESGTGKEEVARLIHRRSRRSARPFVSVNCAAIPTDLFESEFFGHRKGAFTGAVGDREGRFQLAHRGTLFLDEIGCLPEAAQGKVLRVLEEGIFERVGDSRSSHVDVRLITATNVDLENAMESGEFRSDLFFRINVISIRMPPLRERREDIDLLAHHFLERSSLRAGKEIREIAPAVKRAFVHYSWPGNIRELRNVIERAVVLEKGEVLSEASIPQNLMRGEPSEEAGLNLRGRLQGEEKKVLIEALRCAGGVRRQAAQLLGIDERNLSYYLRKHRLSGRRFD
jgi:DNA-binding NtrC family response regulator